jgi:hypothetical protein
MRGKENFGQKSEPCSTQDEWNSDNMDGMDKKP